MLHLLCKPGGGGVSYSRRYRRFHAEMMSWPSNVGSIIEPHGASTQRLHKVVIVDLSDPATGMWVSVQEREFG